MFDIGSGVGGRPSSAKSTFSGKSGHIPNGSGFIDRIHDAMIHGTTSYRDIDNALSAGGHDGNGSPQTQTVSNTSSSRSPGTKNPNTKKKKNRIPSVYYSGDSSGGSPSVVSPSAQNLFDYYEAPIAKHYGFGRETAYQEALANTAYRREMADMRKAGLNPSVIYGSHSTSGAESRIYPQDDYVAYSAPSGDSSGGYRRRSRGNSGKYVFSGGAYYGIMAGVGAITAMATGNVGAGMAAAGLAGTALKALNGFMKK